MKKFQAVVIMIVLVMPASGQISAGGCRGTDRAIGGANGGTPFRGWPYGVIALLQFFLLWTGLSLRRVALRVTLLCPCNRGGQPAVFLRPASGRFLEQGGYARSSRRYS